MIIDFYCQTIVMTDLNSYVSFCLSKALETAMSQLKNIILIWIG